MKLKLAFGIVSAAMLFSACGEDSVTNIQDEAKDKGMITLKVVDSNTGLAIDSAEVYSLIHAETELTDTLGVTTWKKNAIGDYEYTITKDGYATRTYMAILTEDSQGDIARVEDRIQVVYMYKQGVSVKGTVLLRDPQNGNLSAAKGVKVVLSYENSFIVPSEISTKTDTSGVYEFKNLAEGLAYSVKVPQVSVDDMTYAAEDNKAVNDPLRKGEQRVLEPVTMNIVGLNPELIKDNLQTIEVGDKVRLSFSTKLVADSVSAAWKVYKGAVNYYYDDDAYDYVYNYNGNTEVLVTASLDDDGKTVVIKPVSEKWTKLATYTIVGTVYTVEGKSSTVVKKFVPGSAVSKPDLIKDLVASEYDIDDRYIHLTWKKNENEVKGYKVFFQTSESADYEEYKAWGDATVPTNVVSCKKVRSVEYCEEYTVYGMPSVNETNYYWYTDSIVEEGSSLDYTGFDYTFTWTKSSEYEYLTCTPDVGYSYTSCPEYAEYGSYYDYDYDYDENLGDYVYTYRWLVNKTLAVPVTCKAKNYDYNSSYNECYEEYVKYGTNPVTVTNYYKTAYTDSVSCTAGSGILWTDNPKCAAYYEEFGVSNRSDYNYKWYTDYVPAKPDADSKDAYVFAGNIVRDDTQWVKFIVLPFVVVDGDTVTADAVKATPSQYNVED